MLNSSVKKGSYFDPWSFQIWKSGSKLRLYALEANSFTLFKVNQKKDCPPPQHVWDKTVYREKSEVAP